MPCSVFTCDSCGLDLITDFGPFSHSAAVEYARKMGWDCPDYSWETAATRMDYCADCRKIRNMGMSDFNAWQVWRMCTRKKTFDTVDKAKRFADKRSMRAYQCPICNMWHVTHKKL